jgi:hypothetical protein
LSIVMQSHTVYNKQKDLLQSCYWVLMENPTYGADFAHWDFFWGAYEAKLGQSLILHK